MKHGCLSTLNKAFNQINRHGSIESIILVLLNVLMNVDIGKGNYFFLNLCIYLNLHLRNTALRKAKVSFLFHKEYENANKTLQKIICNLIYV